MPPVLKKFLDPDLAGREACAAYWAGAARQCLTWFREFDTPLDWRPPYAEWFLGGELNASYNCLDRHVDDGAAARIALRWEGEPGDSIELTFGELLEQVCRFANVLKHLGIERGDRVAIYLPEIPELVVAMLACSRIGAVHSVVHCGLSSDSLMDRLNDATAVLLVTADGHYQRGEAVELQSHWDEALRNAPSVTAVVTVRRLGGIGLPNAARDHWYHDLVAEADAVCRPEPLASEELLYLLYTSGATGRPKGIMHTTAGFLTQVARTHQQVFDVRPEQDVFWCSISTAAAPGHAYGVYGPLLQGMATLLYEGALDYPDADRFWQIIERHGVTQLYVSPATVRLLMDASGQAAAASDLSALRRIASFGAPLPVQARRWLSRHALAGDGSVIETWWQTETGAIMLAASVGDGEHGPGHIGGPLPGIELDVVDEGGASVAADAGWLVVKHPWPAMLRGVWDAPKRYRQDYWSGPGTAFFTGDYARRTGSGAIRVLGHAEDLIRVADRQVAPIELEALLDGHASVSESVVVGAPASDAGSGDGIVGFAVLNPGVEASDELAGELADFVARQSGGAWRPKRILLVPDLPKTNDGSYMRRLLRDVTVGRRLGDTTTLPHPGLIGEIRSRAAYPENWCWNAGPIEPGRIVIVDIDGVIADAYERMRGIDSDLPRTPGRFENVEQDEVVEEIARLLDLIQRDVHVVLLSARPLSVREATRAWLHRHGVRWDLMILRATASLLLPVNHKRNRTRELRASGFEPLLALEDDPRNVRMFHEEGVPCLYIHSRIHTDPGE